MKKRGLLFVNGEVTEKETDIIRHRTFDKIIAADGGVHHALRFGFTPDVVIGDLDSITETVRAQLPETQFVHRPSQELNDLEKALQFCQEHGFSQLTILGIAGKRLDHTINNFSVLARYDRFFELELYDAYARIYLIRDEIQIQGQEGQLVSLIPIGRLPPGMGAFWVWVNLPTCTGLPIGWCSGCHTTFLPFCLPCSLRIKSSNPAYLPSPTNFSPITGKQPVFWPRVLRFSLRFPHPTF